MSAPLTHQRQFALSALFMLILLITPWSVAQAATPSRPLTGPSQEAASTITLHPVADALIDSSAPGTNFGSSDELQVSQNAILAVTQRTSLLRFDLSVLPTGSIVNRAELRLRQISASGNDWTVNLGRTTTPWEESSVTWDSRPFSTPLYTGLPVPNPGDDPNIVWDVTELVQSWAHGAEVNLGLELIGTQGTSFGRAFSSREGATPPALFIDYTPPPTSLLIAEDLTPVERDGQCKADSEYAGATVTQFVDARGGLATVYLKHDAANLYVCFVAQPGTLPLRFFDLYLDTDNGREKYATDDDYALQVNVDTSRTTSLVGTGNVDQVYTPTVLATWAASASANDGVQDTAEYVISRKLFNRACSSPFGIAFYHRFVHDQGDDYGMPPGRTYANPVTWLEATLENPGCIRVCSLTAEPCGPAPTAALHNAGTGAAYALDTEGYVLNRDQIADGDALWALMPVTTTATTTLYDTSGDRQVVSSSAFRGTPQGTMTLVVSPLHPLLVQDLSVSAQWFVQGDPARAAWLRQALSAAADFLYAFTDGQFTLGQVTVYQSYDQWDQANLKLHTNNVFQPRAVIGGIVPTDTVDIDPSVPLTYSPGSIYMGSYWNRFGTPPGQTVYVDNSPVPTSTMELDWSLALAHELSHYLLFLFDTYTDVDGKASQELAKLCTGSAMGDVYLPSNQGYIYNSDHWQSKCAKTQAYQALKGRTEWETIHLWHPWTITPTGFISGPVLPAGVTQVNFVAPSTAPGELADNQLYDLLYQDNETNSAEARGFIFRGNRVLEQGKPPKGANQIQLIDAQLGDRLCVFDINDHAEASETPRHQFGCETVTMGDATLEMTKNNTWSPLVDLRHTAPNQLVITVTQPVTAPVGLPIHAALYPEHGEKLLDLTLNANGNVHTGVFNLAQAVPPVYVQLYVSETVSALQTRREVVADRGTGGSGAFGPARGLGKVLVVSSDGNSSFESDQPLNLGPGESIAWQSMPGTPPLPPSTQILGQSYRLDAYPATLVLSGTVSIRYEAPENAVQSAGNNQGSAVDPRLYFWDGTLWQSLETSIVKPVDGPDQVLLASARSQGVGVYAVLLENEPPTVFLPLIRR